jgi:hypothetical protein
MFVDTLERTMTWLEYKEWMEFYTLEPWGCAVEDDRAAKLFNAPMIAMAGKEHKWLPAQRIFPRSKSDLPEEEEAKHESKPDLMAQELMLALRGHNLTNAAKEDPTA